ncbi:MAG: hypothetical protein MSG64_00515 [Pyrinomonadaceae bacterium MAG19_C2-C3]|nr:hypothetical protein [Pyrinomonadaceae bacterium MAG19_C2-C3]
MKLNRFYLRTLAFALITLASNAFAQVPNRQPNNQSTQTNQPPRQSSSTTPNAKGQTSNQGVLSFDDYGVELKPDARLIVVMAALDAAGFNPTPNTTPSLFRQEVRAATANLDDALRRRLADFFRLQQRSSGLPALTTNRENLYARQAAPYVSLAFALGDAPGFEAPARTDDLPAEVLDVLDFAPLVQEFYNRSGIAARLPDLMRAAQTQADAMRPAMANTILTGVGYLKTRPQTTFDERITVTAPRAAQNKKSDKNQKQAFTVRERERRFRVVPDPLGVPNTINFRIIGDDYFVALAPGASPASPEVRRAYLQYIIDPLVLRFNRQIALRRLDIKTLLDALLPAGTPTAATVTTTTATTPTATTSGATSATALFPAVTRSLIAAADARIEENLRFNALRQETDVRLKQVTTDAGRATITQENNEARLAIADRTALALSEAYERGAVLSFYFAEQLRGIEESGFDVANFLPDMLASFTVPRELSRLAEAKPARERAAVALAVRRQPTANIIEATPSAASLRNEQLAASLKQIQNLLQLNNYTQAERELLTLRDEYQGDPRILFALGQAASASARDATDERIRDERLNRALAHYRFSIESVRTASDPESGTNRALLSRAFVSIARILEFQDKPTEARRAFDEAIKIGEVEGGAYREAVEAAQNTAKP